MSTEPATGATSEPAAAPDLDASVALPADRSFLVQFRAAARGGPPRAGRVEHLVSGWAARFGDWTELREFVARVLRDSERREPAAPGDDLPGRPDDR